MRLQLFSIIKCFIKFSLICFICASSLFAGIHEDESKIQTISNVRTCLDTLQTIMLEKIQTAELTNLEHAQFEVNTFFASIGHWKANPRDLTSMAWNLYPKFAKAYSLLNHPEIHQDPYFAQNGFKEGVIDEMLNSKIIDIFSKAKTIPFLREDCDPNYLASAHGTATEEGLNSNLTYFMLEDEQKDVLQGVLQALQQEIADCLGSCWKVATIRGWMTPPMQNLWGTTAWHQDGMPPTVYKILYYPLGVDENRGSTLLQLPHGNHMVVGPPGTWLLFKNSEITHRAFAPKYGKRMMLEITITPSIEYDLRPLSAGLNARHPFLPWMELSASKHPLYQKGEIQGVNLGGGPHWRCDKWVNLEEVLSPANPTPFKLHPNCRFPFTDESVKTIYASHTMECLNLPSVYRILSESFRILETNGNLIIKIPDYDKALDYWQRQDHGFFGSEWNIESVTPTWECKGVYDCVDYRAAMIFCSFFNNAYGNPFSGSSTSGSAQAYFGPPNVGVNFLRDLIQNHTPSEISQRLRLEVSRKESDYNFCHQSAWSRAELEILLNKFGFEVISFEPNMISDTFNSIPGINEMINMSTYCWAKKRPAS